MIILILLFDLCKTYLRARIFSRLLIGAGGCVNNHVSLMFKDLADMTRLERFNHVMASTLPFLFVSFMQSVCPTLVMPCRVVRYDNRPTKAQVQIKVLSLGINVLAFPRCGSMFR
jgi:hypothetical protein